MVDSIKYNEELEYIFNQFPSYQQVGKVAYKPGIETMIDFDKQLGYPHKKYATIHIAGTNGKGSVSHMIASVLAQTGAKVGLYTSPHLIDFRERIKINGEMISKEFVLDFILKWKPYMLEKKTSFFEITTAMAFDYFAKEKVDIAVIETGLGGRLDSTNILSPMLSIITNIALDHCEHLGFTIGEIAREKAGIIKAGTPVVIGEALNSTRAVFDRVAEDKDSLLIYAQDSRFKNILASDYELDLKGEYQTHNIRTVLTALTLLGENPQFLKIVGEGWSDKNIRLGLKYAARNTSLRGRWEYLSENPPVICDTGHNANGLKIVFSQLRRQKFTRLFIILGFVVEKDLNKIVGLLPQSAYYIFTQAKIGRALDSETLADRCMAVGFKGKVIPTVSGAIEEYKKIYKDGDLLFIGGSTFVVAEAIEFFEKNVDFFAN